MDLLRGVCRAGWRLGLSAVALLIAAMTMAAPASAQTNCSGAPLSAVSVVVMNDPPIGGIANGTCGIFESGSATIPFPPPTLILMEVRGPLDSMPNQVIFFGIENSGATVSVIPPTDLMIDGVTSGALSTAGTKWISDQLSAGEHTAVGTVTLHNTTYTVRMEFELDDAEVTVNSATFSGGAHGTDSTAPTVTVASLVTLDPTPELTGTVDDPDATISVTVNGQTQGATNRGDGSWILPNDTLSTIPDGTYDVVVTATDVYNNSGTDNTSDELTIDATPPSLQSMSASVPDANGRVPVEIAFNEPVTGFDAAADLSVTDASVSAPSEISPNNGTTYQVLVTPDAGFTGTITLTVVAGAASDAAGNLSTVSPALQIAVAQTAPRVSSMTALAPDANGRVPVEIVFSEPVTGFDAAADLSVTDASVSAPSEISPNDGTTYQVLVTPDADFEGDINLTVVAGAASDAAGNLNTVSQTLEIAVDTLAPSIAVSADQSELAYGDTAAITFTLSEAATDFAVSDVSVTGGTLTDFSGSGTSYRATFTPQIGVVTEGAAATVSVSAGQFSDAAGNLNTVSNVLELDFSEAVIDRTANIITNFMSRRADQITAAEPDLTHRLNRNAGPAQTAGQLTGTGDFRTQNHVGFSTSLAQIAGWQRRALPNRASNDETPVFGARPIAQSQGDVPIDAWVQATYAQIDTETASSTLGLIFLGADIVIEPGLVVGVMAQVDIFEEDDDIESYSGDGLGWMTGPYTVADLGGGLVLDARLAWGQSRNDVSPFGTYSDSFDAERFLVASKITGSMDFDTVNLSPAFGVIYFEERSNGYFDGNGLFIPGQAVSLGRFTFNPNVRHRLAAENGARLDLNWTVKGIWDFDQAELIDLDTGIGAHRETPLRARTEAGLAYAWASGISLRADGFYDGIGADNYDAYGATLTLSLPFD